MVKITFKFPVWEKKLKGAKQRIYDTIAATIQTNRALLFDSEGAYNGHEKWLPLKFRKGMILSDRGTLRKSMGPKTKNGKPVKNTGSIVRYSGGIVEPVVLVGTSLAYAPIHDQGGTIVPKNKPMLWIPLPSGKNASDYTKSLKKNKGKGGPPIVRYKGKTFLLAKKVVIPARPFGQKAWNEKDAAEVGNALAGLVADILNA